MEKIQTREQPMLARLRKLNWQISGKKTRPIWEGDFAFHISNMAQNNKPGTSQVFSNCGFSKKRVQLKSQLNF